jgi:rSAM/selenodomain-associated transferase 2
MFISVIVPTVNEAENIERLLIQLQQIKSATEIIIVDGGSTDNTVTLALQNNAVVLKSPVKGRAAQMNYGARQAKGDVYYFVHADTLPDIDFYGQIDTAIKSGVELGCYQYKFDSKNILLGFNGYMTRFNSIWAGGGDQTLFVKKEVFEQLSGYREDHIIMEDFDLVQRAKKRRFSFKILPYKILVSARKYEKNSWLRVQFANTVIMLAWKLGASQQWMKNKYRKMLH